MGSPKDPRILDSVFVIYNKNSVFSKLFWDFINDHNAVWFGPKDKFPSVSEFFSYYLERSNKRAFTFYDNLLPNKMKIDAIVRISLDNRILNLELNTTNNVKDIRLELFSYKGVSSPLISTLPLLSRIDFSDDKYSEAIKDNLNSLGDLISSQSNELMNIHKKLKSFGRNFCLGRSLGYALATEFCYFLRSYMGIHSESYPAGESKHGPIALIEKGFPVFHFVHDKSIKEKIISSIMEMKARGAIIYVISHLDDSELEDVSNLYIRVNYEKNLDHMVYLGYLLVALYLATQVE